MLDGRSCQDKKTIGVLPQSCMLSFSVIFGEAAGEAALVLPGNGSLPEGYHLMFLPGEGKIAVRAGSSTYPDPDFCGIERSVELRPGWAHQVELLLEHDCMVMYVDRVCAMSARLYRRGPGTMCFQCYGMQAELSGLRIMDKKPPKAEDGRKGADDEGDLKGGYSI